MNFDPIVVSTIPSFKLVANFIVSWSPSNPENNDKYRTMRKHYAASHRTREFHYSVHPVRGILTCRVWQSMLQAWQWNLPVSLDDVPPPELCRFACKYIRKDSVLVLNVFMIIFVQHLKGRDSLRMYKLLVKGLCNSFGLILFITFLVKTIADVDL